jgi:hypothetical protein
VSHCLTDRLPPGEPVLLFELWYLHPPPQGHIPDTGGIRCFGHARVNQEGCYGPILVPAELFTVTFHLPPLELHWVMALGPIQIVSGGVNIGQRRTLI